MKNFEGAAAGCAVFGDDVVDFPELGFVDGGTVITYTRFDELVEKLRHYESRPDELLAIGTSAAQLVHERHTWDHRAGAIAGLIREGPPG